LISPWKALSPDTSLPRTSANVESQFEMVPPFCGSAMF
jgi:hypothetical protein